MNPYDNFKYVTTDRWSSYWHQIKELLELRPNKILEVGVGNHLVYDYFKNRGFHIVSCDIDPATSPDVVGSVEKLPFKEGEFDSVLCAEVLEHLPFERFHHNLAQLRHTSSQYVVLTLPHWGRHLSFDLRLPLVGRLRGQVKISFPPLPQPVKGPHKWEIGRKGTSIRSVRKEIQNAGFEIVKDYVIFEMPYHHLFLLKKK